MERTCPKNSNQSLNKMMNVLGVSLLLTSLAAAGIFSPSPNEKQGASTIVKEGHRVVVVEYDQDGPPNTKISISPEQTTHVDVLDNDKHVLPNLGQGQGISQPLQDDASNFMHAPKELICDAYGKCKHKIVEAMEKTKDKAHDAIHKKKEEIAATKEAARHVGDTVCDAVEKTKDKARHVQGYAQDTVEVVKGHMASNASTVKDVIINRLGIEHVDNVMRLVNLLGFATAYGMCVWVTFISSYVHSRAMPMQQFAVLQSKIYPVYFRAMAYTVGISLLGHALARRNTLFSNKSDMLQAYNLVVSLLTLFVNSLYLEPRATKLMFERIKIEKEEGRGREDMSGERSRTTGSEHPREASTTAADQDAARSRIIKLNDKLKKLNSYSSLLNILNLMSLTWHLVYLAQRLHHTC